MNGHFLLPRGAKLDSDNTLYLVLLGFNVLVWMWFSLLSWFQWIVGRRRRWGRRRRRRKEWWLVDDEDNDGDIDDLFTLYQVHVAPVSSQQAAEKMFSALMCGAFNKAFFYFFCFLTQVEVVYLNKHCVSCKCLCTLAKRLAPYWAMNVQYNIGNESPPIICDVVVQMFRCVLADTLSRICLKYCR